MKFGKFRSKIKLENWKNRLQSEKLRKLFNFKWLKIELKYNKNRKSYQCKMW